MDVRALLRQAARLYSDREAVVDGQVRVTFGQAWERGCKLANGFLALGLSPGDRLGVLDQNSLKSVDAYLGSAIANIARVPLYPRNGRESHRYMLEHTGCRALIVDEDLLDDVRGLETDLPELRHIIVRDRNYEPWLQTQSAHDPDPPISPNDLYAIRHTGGTSGKPKGVPFSHRSWIDAATLVFYNLPPVLLGDKCLHVAPISHGSGYFFLPIWASGGSNVMLNRFDADTTYEIIESESIAYLFVVPTILANLVEAARTSRPPVSSLKAVMVGGAPTSDATALGAFNIFGQVLFQGYGQTEVSFVTMMPAAEWFGSMFGSNPLRSAGRPLPLAEVSIIDDDGHRLMPGTTGEIALRSIAQLDEFWQSPETTAARIVDGWVRTNDVGHLDDNGYLYITDRKDDMIISGGFNIWPRELEQVIETLPGIVEVAVFGVPDERWGETPVAICSLSPGSQVSTHEIIGVCRDALGSYKKPTQVHFATDPLPKTAVGKIDRKKLRESYWKDQERRVAGN